eukprot:1485989-Pleurochrysis_carterae.AAC.1
MQRAAPGAVSCSSSSSSGGRPRGHLTEASLLTSEPCSRLGCARAARSHPGGPERTGPCSLPNERQAKKKKGEGVRERERNGTQ